MIVIVVVQTLKRFEMRNSFRRGTMPFKNALAIKYIALYSKYFTFREFGFVN